MSLYLEKKNTSEELMFMMDDDDFVKKHEVLNNQVDICSICFENCVEFTYKCNTCLDGRVCRDCCMSGFFCYLSIYLQNITDVKRNIKCPCCRTENWKYHFSNILKITLAYEIFDEIWKQKSPPVFKLYINNHGSPSDQIDRKILLCMSIKNTYIKNKVVDDDVIIYKQLFANNNPYYINHFLLEGNGCDKYKLACIDRLKKAHERITCCCSQCQSRRNLYNPYSSIDSDSLPIQLLSIFSLLTNLDLHSSEGVHDYDSAKEHMVNVLDYSYEPEWSAHPDVSDYSEYDSEDAEAERETWEERNERSEEETWEERNERSEEDYVHMDYTDND